MRLRNERGLTLVCVSHDRDLPAALVDREVELVDGSVAYDGPGRRPITTRNSRRRRSRRLKPLVHAQASPVLREGARAEITFLRLVPGDSVVHRLWPGTKLIVAAELALTASVSPSWLTLGVSPASS